MKKYLFIGVVVIALAVTVFKLQQPARISGGEQYGIPDWFKVSFLEIQEDVQEAKQGNKQVLLFMHLDGCPYCKLMLDENFRQGPTRDYLEKNFDVIAINIRGDREVDWDADHRYDEKELAQALGVHATPTLVFLDGDGSKVYQINGYRKPTAFLDALHYVHQRQYEKISLADYVKQQGRAIYTLEDNPAFEQMTDFSQYKGPLAVIFEDPSCADCADFHNYTLAHPDVIAEMKNLKVVRLNAWSNEPILDNQGNKTTPHDWAQALKLDYRPGTVLFDGGEEITRADGQLYHFHYKELLRYVSHQLYFEYPTYLSYLGNRQQELLKQGVNIDLSR